MSFPKPLRYVPGTTTAIGGKDIALMVGLPPENSIIDRLLDVIDAGGASDDVMDVLLSGGIRSVPDFAMFERSESGLRVLCRGRFKVSVSGESMATEGVAWLDRTVESGEVALIDGDSRMDRPEIAFREGVVLAASIRTTSGPEVSAAVASHVGAATAGAGASSSGSEVPPLPILTPDALPEPAASGENSTFDEGPQGGPGSDPHGPGSDPRTEKMANDLPSPPSAGKVAEKAPGQVELQEEQVSGFDFLFGATTARPATPEAPEPESSALLPTVEAMSPTLDPTVTTPSPLTTSLSQSLEREMSDAEPHLLITSMPWESSGGGEAYSLVSTDAAVSRGYEPSSLHEPVVPAHVPTPPESAPPPLAAAAVDRTVNREQLRAASIESPTVVAARCPVGHLSPAYAGVCRVCRALLPPQQPFETARPNLGVLRLSTGTVVSLDRGAILGRNPRIPRDFKGEQPNLVQVVDPDRDVSSQHLEVSLDYWNVMVRDLGSTNGTEVVLPGEMPTTLRPGDPMLLEPGARVVMGGSVSFVFEVTS